MQKEKCPVSALDGGNCQKVFVEKFTRTPSRLKLWAWMFSEMYAALRGKADRQGRLAQSVAPGSSRLLRPCRGDPERQAWGLLVGQ